VRKALGLSWKAYHLGLSNSYKIAISGSASNRDGPRTCPKLNYMLASFANKPREASLSVRKRRRMSSVDDIARTDVARTDSDASVAAADAPRAPERREHVPRPSGQVRVNCVPLA
jgi:hypothetical protein